MDIKFGTLIYPLSILGLTLTANSALSQSMSIDLNNWSQEGQLANGNWVVSSDGSSVLQTINGNPTFFVSPEDFIDTKFNGSFGVETTFDNDLIGFVFGYQSPITDNGDDVSDYEFLLFDWKQANQNFGGVLSQEGFSLNKINGTFPTSNLPFAFSEFWARTDNLPEFNNLASRYGSDLGWQDNVTYDFTLLYQSNRIKVDIQGGNGIYQDGLTIFDVTPFDVGLTSFESGKFGFYNYSQQSVRYQGFTEESMPPEPPTKTPEPVSIFGLLTIVGSILLGKRNLHNRYI